MLDVGCFPRPSSALRVHRTLDFGPWTLDLVLWTLDFGLVKLWALTPSYTPNATKPPQPCPSECAHSTHPDSAPAPRATQCFPAATSPHSYAPPRSVNSASHPNECNR